MESLVCLQILRPPRNSQGTSRPVAGHISPPRFELSDPRFMQNLCWKESARPFVSAKTKKRCQLKCCNYNLSINVVYKRTRCLNFVYFDLAATQKPCRHLVGPSLPRPALLCFGLVWSNHIAGKMDPEMDIRRTAHWFSLSVQSLAKRESYSMTTKKM